MSGVVTFCMVNLYLHLTWTCASLAVWKIVIQSILTSQCLQECRRCSFCHMQSGIFSHPFWWLKGHPTILCIDFLFPYPEYCTNTTNSSHHTSHEKTKYFFLFTLNQKKIFRPSRQEKNSKSMKSWSYLYSSLIDREISSLICKVIGY